MLNPEETEAQFEQRWWELMNLMRERFGKKPDMNALLLLIGVQELGQGAGPFTKEQKQDLMHIATCKIFSYSGYYELDRVDEEGWPHYRLVRPVPFANLKEQERMLKWHVLEYFDAQEDEE
ncbi:hypothetical protein HMJ29_07040 [Hymenobacter taeanensis]|uniref:Uncharacterized protein n=1 Tax=Hymenobacter taeanensis TaxID=2735321 RepID=A0A6M6BER3_9BACT|nr:MULTISPECIES: hypothetical protein [Hymenobacter]QJX46707.1 hypothetical protein HMJ29_07040 [Hymenobacter taeanensis]UOQ80572.1 hypothetical protein MUN83_17385 [Hymenobacter sp. 5414T-23]